MLDDMGTFDAGSYGSTAIATPNIDRLAAEGMRFTQAYSGCAVCAPAASTLMTGKHMGHTSVRGNSGGISLLDEDFTVAELLKQAGYTSGGFGKWGLGDFDTPGVPERQGFDRFFGHYHQVHAHYYYWTSSIQHRPGRSRYQATKATTTPNRNSAASRWWIRRPASSASSAPISPSMK